MQKRFLEGAISEQLETFLKQILSLRIVNNLVDVFQFKNDKNDQFEFI